MKRILFYLTVAIATLLCALSCTQEIEGDGLDGREKARPAWDGEQVTLTATLDDNIPETKTQLSADGKFRWSPNDQINVIYGSGYGSVFTSTNTEPAATAQFTGKIHAVTGYDEEAPDLKFWGIYPSWQTNNVEIRNGTATAFIHFPYYQMSGENTWGQEQFVYVGQSDGLAMGFRNLCGGFKFYLERDDIKEIRFKSNDDKYMAGIAGVRMVNGIPTIISFAIQDSYKEIRLFPENSGTFKKSVEGNITWYYMAIPPRTYSNGVTFTFYTADGQVGTRTFSSINAVRNQFISWEWPSKALDRSDKVTFTDITAENNQIIYFASSELDDCGSNWLGTFLYNGIDMDGDGVFENPIVSHEFSNGCGILTFQNTVTGVPDYAFENAPITKVILPETVTTFGANPFVRCRSLKTFSSEFATTDGKFLIKDGCLVSTALGAFNANTDCIIPTGVTTIGNSALMDITANSVVLHEDVTSVGAYALLNASLAYVQCKGDNLPTLGETAFSNDQDGSTFPIRITGYATKASMSLLQDENSWSIYRNAKRVHVYQDYDEIWYHIDQNGTMTLNNLDFGGSEGSAYAEGTGFLFLTNIYTPIPCTPIPATLTLPTSIGVQKFTGDVSNVPANAFKNKSGLEYVSLPTAETIGASAFQGTSLKCFPLADANALISIGAYAFQGCSLMAGSLSLSQLSSLGEEAFANCRALTSVALGSDLEVIPASAFSGCSALSSLTLSEGLEYIGTDAFSGCTALTSVSLPSTILAVGHLSSQTQQYNPFRGCSSLTSFSSSSSAVTVTSDGKFLLGNNGTYLISGAIGGFAKASCTIPYGVTDIGPMAFSGANMTALDFFLDNTGNCLVTTLHQYCFELCESLWDVLIPISVSSVEVGSFIGCTALERVKFDDYTQGQSYTLPTLEANVFDNTHADLTIRICGAGAVQLTSSNSLYSYRSQISVYQSDQEIWYCGLHQVDGTRSPAATNGTLLTYNDVAMNADSFGGQLAPTFGSLVPKVALPSALASEPLRVDRYTNRIIAVGDNAFKDNTDATFISLPELVRSIGNSAFAGCTSLQNFPAKSNAYVAYQLTSIGSNAFNGCTAMTSVDAPYVTSLGAQAFYNCTALESVSLTAITQIGNRAFGFTNNLTTLRLGANLTTLGSEIFYDNSTSPANFRKMDIYFNGTSWFNDQILNAFRYNIAGNEVDFLFKTVHLPVSLVDAFTEIVNQGHKYVRSTTDIYRL